MTAFTTLAAKAFSRAVAYRAAFVTELAINLLFMMLYLFLWRALTDEATKVGLYDRRALLSYIVVAQTVMTVQFTVRVVWEIEKKVRSGAIVTELMRPIDFQLATLATACGPALHTLVFNMLPKLILFGAAGVLAAPPTAFAGALVAVSAAIGFLVQFGIELCIGLSAFWLVEIRGLHLLLAWGIGAFFSGYFAPLEVYPAWLAAIARSLPFHAVVYTPSAIWSGGLVGSDAVRAVGAQIAWAVGLALAGRGLLVVARRRLAAQGG